MYTIFVFEFFHRDPCGIWNHAVKEFRDPQEFEKLRDSYEAVGRVVHVAKSYQYNRFS
jgi:hypothetical protein